MPVTLDTPRVNSKRITDYEITSFTVDVGAQIIKVRLNLLGEEGDVLDKHDYKIEGSVFSDAVQRANAVAGGNVYAAIKTALYEAYLTAQGETGTITD